MILANKPKRDRKRERNRPQRKSLMTTSTLDHLEHILSGNSRGGQMSMSECRVEEWIAGRRKRWGAEETAADRDRMMARY